MSILTLPGDRMARVSLGACPEIVPLDPARGHASGPAPYRVLLVGGDAVAGAGVLTHDLAVTGNLARSLGRILGHGVDVTTVVERHLDIHSAEDAVWGARLRYYDALVLVLEPDSGRRAQIDFANRLQSLLFDAASRMPENAAITVAVSPPFRTDQLSRADFNAYFDLVRQTVEPQCRAVALDGSIGGSAPAEMYAAWADEIAAATAACLREPTLWTDPTEVIDEERRLDSVRCLGMFDAQWGTTFNRIVSLAQAAYGTRMAGLSIVDAETTHCSVSRGYAVAAAPRSETICDRVLSTYGGVILGDARIDARFATLPPVLAGDVAFYAGYRINAPDGQPVGALWVADSQPRPVLGQDIALLRDFALAAERRLWALMRERSSAPRGVASA